MSKRTLIKTVVVPAPAPTKPPAPSVDDMLNETLGLIQSDLKRISTANHYKNAISDTDFRRLMAMSKALKDLSTEKRTLSEDQSDEVSKLSDEDLQKLAKKALKKETPQ